MHLDFLASIHLNQTAILQMQAVCSSQTLQQTLARECKNKEKEKTHFKNKHDENLKPYIHPRIPVQQCYITPRAVTFPNLTTAPFHASSEGDRHCALYDQ